MSFQYLRVTVWGPAQALLIAISISLMVGCSPVILASAPPSSITAPQSMIAPRKLWHVIPILKTQQPIAIALDLKLDVYFTGYAAHEASVLLPGGTVKNLGGHLYRAYGIAVFKKLVYVADSAHALVKKISPDGRVAELGSGWKGPVSIGTDTKGDVYVLDSVNQNIVRLRQNEQTTIFTAPNGCGVTRMGTDASGNLYVSCIASNEVLQVNQQTGASKPVCSGWQSPAVVGSDAAGDVYVSNSGTNGNKLIFECSASGKFSTIQPDADIGSIAGIAPYDGDLYIAGTGKSEIYKLVPPQ
jgi:DNA-binding beta-propeller fold protein YncE